MTRLLILIFALNVLLPSVGFSAMPVSNADYTMSQTTSHSMTTACSDLCDTETALCEIECSTTCAQIPLLSSTPILLSVSVYSGKNISVFTPFYTRSISPELRPPLV
jgi:cytochrome c biogenesis factor